MKQLRFMSVKLAVNGVINKFGTNHRQERSLHDPK